MTITINLLPWREELKERQKKEFFSMLGLGVAIAFGLMACVHFYMNRQIALQQANNDYLREEIKILDQQLVEITNLQKEKERLLARMEIIQQLQSSRPEIVRLFDVIVRTIPDGLYLTNLERKGSLIIFDGKAESNTRVSTFMRNIEGSRLLKSPLLSSIEAEDQKQTNQSATASHTSEEKLIDFHLQATESVSAPNLENAKVPSGKTGSPEVKKTKP